MDDNLMYIFTCTFMFAAKYLVSCEEARLLNPTLSEKDMHIDIDDSGPLEPFPVKCVFQRKCRSMLNTDT